MAVKSLRSAKWRSLLTMLGIIIGVSSVITVVSLGEGLKQQVVGQVNDISSDVLTVRPGKLVGNSNQDLNLLAFFSTSTLSEQDVESISKLPSVGSVAPIDFVTNGVKADGRQLDNTAVLGTKAQLSELMQLKLDIGDFFSAESEKDNVAVIGAAVASELFQEVNPVGHSVNVLGQDFIIRGLIKPSGGGLVTAEQINLNYTVFLPLEPAKALVGGRVNIPQILIKTREGTEPDAAAAQVRQALVQNRGGTEDFTVLKQEQLLSLAGGAVNTATSFMTALATIALLVGGIGIMNIMLASVTERTREIGIRKAVGATNRQILSQFLTEGLALTITGGIIGILVSLAIFGLLRLYTGLQPVITLPVILIAVGVSVAIGIIFTVAPALKAARKDPIVALRGE